MEEKTHLEAKDDSREGTPSITIDPASSDSLTVLSQRISTDEILDDPTMDINGEIQNNGTQSLDFVKVTATFYDMGNSVIGSDFTYTDPDFLNLGNQHLSSSLRDTATIYLLMI